MCLIIDANCCHCFFKGHEDGKVVHEWVAKRGKIATGGLNLRELLVGGMGALLAEYKRAGRIKEYTNVALEAQTPYIDLNLVKSNDVHVIKLARVSGSRIIFTKDNLLKSDLRQAALVPRRNQRTVEVYQSKNDKTKLYNSLPCH